MCGIAALFSYGSKASLVNYQELEAITNSMTLRGPDDSGVWLSEDKKIGLGHRRLSILDLSSRARQPMKISSLHGKAGEYRISYNGEIYNFMELRRDLETDGVEFLTTSDTEVILRLYERFGSDMLGKLRGMFAFIIWDECNKELFLARDPYGIKPLYYYDDGKHFWAASQVKSLQVCKNLDSTPSPEGHVGFFLFGNVPEPHTLFKLIKGLPAGHSMRVTERGIKSINCYFNLSSHLLNAGESVAKNYDLREIICESLDSHFVSDVPVGLFLSGGVDSASLAALASEKKGPGLKTITLGFSEFKDKINDEVPLALKVSDQYETDHHTEYVSDVDFHKSLKNILIRMDQPTIDGVNTYFVSQAAKSQGLKVAISGLGGDEVFGGYNTFRQIPKLVQMVSKIPSRETLGRILRILLQPVLKKFWLPKWSGLIELGGSIGGAYLLRRGLYMPWELPEIMDPDLAREGLLSLSPINLLENSCSQITEPQRKIAVLESVFYLRNQLLRDSDWAGMAHSLEIRLPFVDKILFEALAPVLMRGEGPTKLKLAMAPLRPIPSEIINRKKSGFFVPIENWLGKDSGNKRLGLRSWAKKVYRSTNSSLKY